MFTSEKMSRLIEYPVIMDQSDRNAFKADIDVSSKIYAILQEVE